MEIKDRKLTGTYIALNKTALYAEMVSINYARKANSDFDINTTDYSHLSQDAKSYIAKLPVVNRDWIDWMEPEDFDGTQQFYLINDEGVLYLVDTQGYSYIRYVTRLKNFQRLTASVTIYNHSDDDEIVDTYDRMEGLIRVSDQKIFESIVSNITNDLREDGFDGEDIGPFLDVLLFKAIQKTK